jgi:hypothetical protein
VITCTLALETHTPITLAHSSPRYNLDDYDNEEDLAGSGAALAPGAGNGLAGLVYHASNADDPYLARGPDEGDAEDDDDEIDDFRVRPDDNLLVVGQTEDVYSHLSVNGETHLSPSPLPPYPSLLYHFISPSLPSLLL